MQHRPVDGRAGRQGSHHQQRQPNRPQGHIQQTRPAASHFAGHRAYNAVVGKLLRAADFNDAVAPQVAIGGEHRAPRHILNMNGLQTVVAGADDRRGRRHFHQPGDGVGELVAGPENQRGPEDGVRHPAVDNLLFALPFGIQVLQLRRVGGAHGADMDNAPHRAGGPGGGGQMRRPLAVDGVKLPAVAADDRHQVHHGGDFPAGFRKRVGVGDVAVADVRGRRGENRLAAGAPHHNPDFLPAVQQALHHAPAQKAGGSGYQNGHNNAQTDAATRRQRDNAPKTMRPG